MSFSPISLHPENPHYFLFRGKPTVLITSAEHYGAVLNADFDFISYLDTLHAAGLNYTRIFTGDYVETASGIPWVTEQNPLHAQQGRLLAPWARSGVPGYANGGHKFDLARWDVAYFARLQEFVRQADARDIVVEVTLHCVQYMPEFWAFSPLHARNNINSVGNNEYNQVNDPDNSELLHYQVATTQQIVHALAEFENVIFELINEPYWSQGIPQSEPGVTKEENTPTTLAWQYRILDAIVDAESALPRRHLIAQNINNNTDTITDPHPQVDIYNFHYASPPVAVPSNYHWNKPIAFDETWDGTVTDPRRREAWAFILAGGAVYNNLDWSFMTDDPTGSGTVAVNGKYFIGTDIRNQLKVLKDFMESLDFIHMAPTPEIIQQANGTADTYVLAMPGRCYALYLLGDDVTELTMAVPTGSYRAEWIDTRTGAVTNTALVPAVEGLMTLAVPCYDGDIALRLFAG